MERTSNGIERMSAGRRTERNGVCEDDGFDKQTARQLRGQANGIDNHPGSWGKEGIGDNLVKQANDA